MPLKNECNNEVGGGPIRCAVSRAQHGITHKNSTLSTVPNVRGRLDNGARVRTEVHRHCPLPSISSTFLSLSDAVAAAAAIATIDIGRRAKSGRLRRAGSNPESLGAGGGRMPLPGMKDGGRAPKDSGRCQPVAPPDFFRVGGRQRWRPYVLGRRGGQGVRVQTEAAGERPQRSSRYCRIAAPAAP